MYEVFSKTTTEVNLLQMVSKKQTLTIGPVGIPPIPLLIIADLMIILEQP